MPIDVAADLARIVADAAGLALAVVYTPVSAWSVDLRAVPVRGERVTPLADPHVARQVTGWLIEVAELAAPAPGDTLAVGDQVWTVSAPPVLDARGALWRLEVWPAAARTLAETLVFERQTLTTNALGEKVVGSTATLATVAGSAQPVGAAEALRAGQIEARTMLRFTLRAASSLATLAPTDQVSWGGVVYGITGVQRLGGGQWIEVLAERGDGG